MASPVTPCENRWAPFQKAEVRVYTVALEYVRKVRLIVLEQVLPVLQETVDKGSSILELGAVS